MSAGMTCIGKPHFLETPTIFELIEAHGLYNVHRKLMLTALRAPFKTNPYAASEKRNSIEFKNKFRSGVYADGTYA